MPCGAALLHKHEPTEKVVTHSASGGRVEPCQAKEYVRLVRDVIHNFHAAGDAQTRVGGDGVTPPAPWIYRPWLDLLIGCGAWSAPLVLTNYVSPCPKYFLVLCFLCARADSSTTHISWLRFTVPIILMMSSGNIDASRFTQAAARHYHAYLKEVAKNPELKATEQHLGPAAHGLNSQISRRLLEALSLRPSAFAK